MKVNSLQITNINNKISDNKNTNPVRYSAVQNFNSTAPSFTGVDPTSCLIDFWAAIARGGHAASFTVQDMFGTNFPRTYAALDRNKDITGKNNYKAAVEVAIREFTTGPSMFIVPAIVLAAATRLSGEANKVDTNNIAVFSDIMKGTISNLAENEFKNIDFKTIDTKEAKDVLQTIKKAFYKDTFENIFKQYDIGENKVNINEYVDMMMQIEDPNVPKRNFLMSMFKKRVKVLGKEVDSKDEILSKLCSKFVEDKKANTTGWGDFLSTKVRKGGKTFKINDIAADMKNFTDDFAKNYIAAQRKGAVDVSGRFIENFKDMRIGTRCVTNIAIVVATGLFMSIIPKLYTRNKTNPETDAIYEQVNQQRKGAVNEDNK